MTPAWIALALAAGYAMGRLRPARRASGWAAWVAVTSRQEQRRYRWPALAIMCIDIFVHPVRSYRNIRNFKSRSTERRPAPALRPEWAAKSKEQS